MLPDALRQQLKLDQVIADVRHLTSSLEWFERPSNDGGVGAGKTTIDLSIALGPLSYRVSTHFECGDDVIAPATMQLATRDGKLNATVSGQFRIIARGGGALIQTAGLWSMAGDADLRDVSGTSRLPIDSRRIHIGDLWAGVGSQIGGSIGGNTRVSLKYFASEMDLETWLHDTNPPSDVVHGTYDEDDPIEGDFPIPPPPKVWPPCTPGQMSVPHSPEDPCDQNAPQCAGAGSEYVAIATCGPDAKWGPMCDCVQRTMP